MTATLEFLRSHLMGRYVTDITETADGETIIITSRPIGRASERYVGIRTPKAHEVLKGSRVLADIAAARRLEAEGRVA